MVCKVFLQLDIADVGILQIYMGRCFFLLVVRLEEIALETMHLVRGMLFIEGINYRLACICLKLLFIPENFLSDDKGILGYDRVLFQVIFLIFE